MEKKIKAYKFSMLMSIICIIISGVNYIAFKLPIVGVACILVIIAFIITLFGYKMETKNINKS
ncbi:hypothetical protein PCCS19_50530 [Paenibacillus sp. CCS19]|uniref:hypothetical protein n=1 Tax=Paenibacillus sp. CCS19 TaxID=3158387 RepID=UPI0025622D94|nr:hypothetical protein [Paenibacillus cellulosilyticus]GMK41994.1 hypothetical protein PCCS19_50530 [Paenibacillus cellulosilyticus]